MKTPEQIATEIVDKLSFGSNRMLHGRLVSESYFAAVAITEAIHAERSRAEDFRCSMIELASVIAGLNSGRLTRRGRRATQVFDAAMATLDAHTGVQ